MKKYAAALLAALAMVMAIPSVASADVFDELNAASAVERKLDNRYPRWDWLAFCDQLNRTKFSCEITGFGRGLSTADGRATAIKLGPYKRFSTRINWIEFD